MTNTWDEKKKLTKVSIMSGLIESQQASKAGV